MQYLFCEAILSCLRRVKDVWENGFLRGLNIPTLPSRLSHETRNDNYLDAGPRHVSLYPEEKFGSRRRIPGLILACPRRGLGQLS